ncbi:hypothetical protein AYI78_00110 [Shewanella algae]|nr:hypothetical protein AYI76_00110 [Shewanella algae]TVO89426.1 hypothetical protein AYI78_00110 [Shewanella algae]TVO99419.1 hypothetical protein AYI79_00110 [Shewanella algae]
MFVLTIEKQWSQPPDHSLNIHQRSTEKLMKTIIKEPFGSYVFVTDWLQLFGNLEKTMTEQALNQH